MHLFVRTDAYFLCPNVIRLFFYIRQEIGHDSKQWKESRKLEHILNAGNISKPTKERGAYATQSERQSEEGP